MKIKNNIKKVRIDKNYTQIYLANLSNISLRSYQCYESGKRIANVITAIKISEILGIEDLDEFKELFEQPRKNSYYKK